MNSLIAGATLREATQPTADYLALLSSIEWGTSGLRYRTPDAAHDVQRLPRPRLLSLHDETERLIATSVLSPRELRLDGRTLAGHYWSLFTVRPDQGGKGVGRGLIAHQKQRWCEAQREPSFIYGFIETDNHHSLKAAAKAGYEEVASLQCPNLGWFFPRYLDAAEVLPSGSRGEMCERLRQQYAGQVLPDFEASLLDGEAFVLRRAGRLVAACQVVEKHMQVSSLPGLDGQVLMRAEPLLKRFSPAFTVRQRKLLWVGHLWAAAGEEWALARLIEGLMARFGAHGGLSYFDPRCPVYARFKQAGVFGPIRKLSPVPQMKIVMASNAAMQPMLDSLRSRAWHVSALDAA